MVTTGECRPGYTRGLWYSETYLEKADVKACLIETPQNYPRQRKAQTRLESKHRSESIMKAYFLPVYPEIIFIHSLRHQHSIPHTGQNKSHTNALLRTQPPSHPHNNKLSPHISSSTPQASAPPHHHHHTMPPSLLLNIAQAKLSQKVHPGYVEVTPKRPKPATTATSSPFSHSNNRKKSHMASVPGQPERPRRGRPEEASDKQRREKRDSVGGWRGWWRSVSRAGRL